MAVMRIHSLPPCVDVNPFYTRCAKLKEVISCKKTTPPNTTTLNLNLMQYAAEQYSGLAVSRSSSGLSGGLYEIELPGSIVHMRACCARTSMLFSYP